MNVDLVFEVIKKDDSKRIFSFYDEIMLHIQILKVVLQVRRLEEAVSQTGFIHANSPSSLCKSHCVPPLT